MPLHSIHNALNPNVKAHPSIRMGRPGEALGVCPVLPPDELSLLEMSTLQDIPLFEGKPAEVLIVGFGAVGIICGFTYYFMFLKT